MNWKIDNEVAAGGIIALFFCFLLAGILFVITSFGVDRMSLMVHTMSAVNASQMRFDVFEIQKQIFRFEPLIMLLGIGINYFVNQIRVISGSVEIGTLLRGAGEMIVLTIFLMMINLFGGQAVDFVVSFVNNWQFEVVSDMFLVIQYVGVVFYGIIMLLTIAVVVQFVILCVQTVDYANTYTY